MQLMITFLDSALEIYFNPLVLYLQIAKNLIIKIEKFSFFLNSRDACLFSYKYLRQFEEKLRVWQG